jgi:Type VI secretion system (T6SS), amidase effector protein 4
MPTQGVKEHIGHKLPSFEKLLENYPSGPPESVKSLIGGDVDSPQVTDTCAVRMSRALNLSGILIPGKTRGLYTVSGRDQRDYALRVQELKQWIQNRFGPPQITAVKLSASKPIDRKQFEGSKGIIAFDIVFGLNPDHRTRALGHLDLWDGKNYTHEAEDPRDYFTLATKVVLWVIPN